MGDLNGMQRIGILVFVFLCGVPAMEINGFGLGLPISLPIGLVVSVLGGLVGGALICSRPIAAGMIGGLLAGPMVLIATLFYTQGRSQVHTLELTLVGMVAVLPGLGVGYAIKKLFGSSTDV